MLRCGLLRGACHRARVRATRWLAMMGESVTLSVNQSRTRSLFERGGERAIFLACRAGELRDFVQVILRLIAVALFDLPQAVILPGLDVVRIGLERALIPDLRDLVVAELAIGIADQVGNGG